MEKLRRNYENLKYYNGFGNHFVSEAIPKSIPEYQNTPKKVNYGLYTEQLNGTAFTLPRSKNKRSWLYRIQPSATQGKLKKTDKYKHIITDFNDKKNYEILPTQLRWKPLETKNKDFLEGLVTFTGSGSIDAKNGICIYGYCCDKSMKNKVFNNSDGDFLIVPQKGTLLIMTEFGRLAVKPQEICVIPRGIRFQVEITELSRGWIAEVYNSHF